MRRSFVPWCIIGAQAHFFYLRYVCTAAGESKNTAHAPSRAGDERGGGVRELSVLL